MTDKCMDAKGIIPLSKQSLILDRSMCRNNKKQQTMQSLSTDESEDTKEREDCTASTPTVKVHHLCTVCGRTFEDISMLHAHISKSHFHIPCFVCYKILMHFSGFEQHLYTHTAEIRKGYLCDICGHMIKGPVAFFRHLYWIHGKEGSYACNLCKKAFHSSKILKWHQKSHKPKVKCLLCDKYILCENLDRHMLTHRECKHTCEICGKEFTRKESLEFHMNKHRGIKPYVCDQCGKTFSDKRHRYNHQLSHNKEKLYKCGICGFKTNTKATRNKHLKIHSELTKKFKCEYCSKLFRSSVQLREHTNMHTGERPYECKLCGKRFRWRSNVKEHLETQHGMC